MPATIAMHLCKLHDLNIEITTSKWYYLVQILLNRYNNCFICHLQKLLLDNFQQLLEKSLNTKVKLLQYIFKYRFNILMHIFIFRLNILMHIFIFIWGIGYNVYIILTPPMEIDRILYRLESKKYAQLQCLLMLQYHEIRYCNKSINTSN